MIIASDLEGTLTTGYIGLSLGHYVREHGRGLTYRLFFARQVPSYLLYKVGLLSDRDFKGSFVSGSLGLFRGFTTDQFTEVAEWVVEHRLWPARRSDVIAELQHHYGEGHRVVIVSAGVAPVAERFAARMGLSDSIGTPIEVVDGHLTGKIGGPYNSGTGKVKSLKAYLDGGKLAIAYGDTISDHDMLEMSLQPVAVYPDEKLAQLATERGWRVLSDE